MVHSTAPPSGSNIQIDNQPDGVTYSWTSTQRHPMQRIPMLFGGVMMMQAVVMLLIFCFGEQNDLTPGLLVVSCLFLGSAGATLLWAGLQRRGRETLELHPDSVVYDNGPSVMPLPLMWFFGFPFLLGPQFYAGNTSPMPHYWRKKLAMPLDSIGPFTLERVGERQRLRVDQGRERIEIGVLLSEPEREWLSRELMTWQNRTKPAN